MIARAVKLPISITLAEAVVAVRRAFDKGRLGAQNNQKDYLCHYADGSVCPIGATVTIPESHNEHGVIQLVRDRVLSCSQEDRRLLAVLQELHDDWIDGKGYGMFAGDRPETEWVADWVRRNWKGDYVTAETSEDFLTTAERNLKRDPHGDSVSIQCGGEGSAP